MGLIGVAEGFPVRNPQISFVDVTDGMQFLNDRIEKGVILNDHIHINAGLGSQSLHGGAAHVLDAQNQTVQGICDFLPNFLKCGFPCLVIGQDKDLRCMHKEPPCNLRLQLFYHEQVKTAIKKRPFRSVHKKK